ncbi:hypothetical protein C8046_13975 [Serinibacter arcticus]|uniref:Serine aminopeptidase S33 domain-containing protein n=1 Tax=Serinibacter arcticus TaxID=1655435 RepID=A0A2U1ZX70_9MICO|nr:alpha/beta hydrolase [Serinibacter arcticus]PWD51586.1 hypothetical protein C8046_13975 [Serinibacter arcticus]
MDPVTTTYDADVLGGEFVSRTIPLADDGDGPDGTTATLVRCGTPTRERAVLFVHGFSDYFFQAQHARNVVAGGLDFYALDLRRYGRSLRPGQVPALVRDVAEYDEEILAALAIIRSEGHRQVVLVGHSTGGLVVTLFAHHHPRSIHAVVLNSPWYDINDTPLRRSLSGPLAAVASWRDPDAVISRLSRTYTASIHASTGGEWDFDLAWKPLEGFPVRASWLSAIRRAQRRVAEGLDLRVPVLMATSTRSGGAGGTAITPAQVRTTDTVLDVRHMWAVAGKLGSDVTLRTVPNGMHDLALSPSPAREDYEHALLDWIDRRL